MIDDYEDQDLKSQDSSNGNSLLRDRKLENAFKNEARVLCLLRSLKHSNIIELLASFSFPRLFKGELRYEHNFLFPLAESILSTILANQETDALSLYFKTDQNLYEQLFGLSSAIESVHNYFSDEFNLTLIDCHHDLNHRNILVSKDKLLLADFGLSRLRPESFRSLF
jgi:thiamine kinase-like enzyme